MNLKDLFSIDLSECSTEAKEILNLAVKYKLGHVPSALSYVGVVDYAFDMAKREDSNIEILLGKPHGALALYRNWINNGWMQEEELNNLLSVYRQSDQDRLQIPYVGYVANTLGNAIGVGIGKAITNPDKRYKILVSDSSFLMGTSLEALMQLKRLDLDNLDIIVDYNGWTSKSEMPMSLEEFSDLTVVLDITKYFTIFGSTKGQGVPEMEEEPGKWHY